MSQMPHDVLDIDIGTRLIAAHDIERYPHALIPEGDTLLVTEVTGDSVWAFDLTRHVKGLEDWGNCVQFDKDRDWIDETHPFDAADAMEPAHYQSILYLTREEAQEQCRNLAHLGEVSDQDLHAITGGWYLYTSYGEIFGAYRTRQAASQKLDDLLDAQEGN